MLKLAESRFGKDFVEDQRSRCRELWKTYNPHNKATVDYNTLNQIFQDIYRKINLDDEVSPDDLVNVFETIDVIKDNTVDFKEFELWYFRGILGT